MFSIDINYCFHLLPSLLQIFPCWFFKVFDVEAPFHAQWLQTFHLLSWDHRLALVSSSWMGWTCAQPPWTNFACTLVGLSPWPGEVHQFNCQLWHGTQMMGLLGSPIQYPMRQLIMPTTRFQGLLQEPLHSDPHMHPRRYKAWWIFDWIPAKQVTSN